MNSITDMSQYLRAKIRTEMNNELAALSHRQCTPDEVIAVRTKYEKKLDELEQPRFNKLSGELNDAFEQLFDTDLDDDGSLDELAKKLDRLAAMTEALSEFVNLSLEDVNRLEAASYLAEITCEMANDAQVIMDRIR